MLSSEGWITYRLRSTARPIRELMLPQKPASLRLSRFNVKILIHHHQNLVRQGFCFGYVADKVNVAFPVFKYVTMATTKENPILPSDPSDLYKYNEAKREVEALHKSIRDLKKRRKKFGRIYGLPWAPLSHWYDEAYEDNGGDYMSDRKLHTKVEYIRMQRMIADPDLDRTIINPHAINLKIKTCQEHMIGRGYYVGKWQYHSKCGAVYESVHLDDHPMCTEVSKLDTQHEIMDKPGLEDTYIDFWRDIDSKNDIVDATLKYIEDDNVVLSPQPATRFSFPEIKIHTLIQSLNFRDSIAHSSSAGTLFLQHNIRYTKHYNEVQTKLAPNRVLTDDDICDRIDDYNDKTLEFCREYLMSMTCADTPLNRGIESDVKTLADQYDAVQFSFMEPRKKPVRNQSLLRICRSIRQSIRLNNTLQQLYRYSHLHRSIHRTQQKLMYDYHQFCTTSVVADHPVGPEVKFVPSYISESLDYISGKYTNAKEVVEEVTTMLSRKEIGKFRTETIEMFFTNVHKMMENFFTKMKSSVVMPLGQRIVSMCAALLTFQRGPQTFGDLLLLITSLVSNLPLTSSGKLLTAIREYWEGPKENITEMVNFACASTGCSVKPEAADDNFLIKAIYPLTLGVVAFVYSMSSTPMPGGGALDGIVKKIIKTGNLARACTSIFNLVFAIFGVTTLELLNSFCGVDFSLNSLRCRFQEVNAFVKESETLLGKIGKTMYADYSEVDMLLTMYFRGLRLYQGLVTAGYPTSNLVPLHNLVTLLSKEYEKYQSQIVGQGMLRDEPLIISMTGPSGLGKSTLTMYMLIDLFKAERPTADPKEFADEIFYRGDSEFWNGYKGQFACVFDDFLQKKDTITTPNVSAMEVIRTNNVAPFPLNQAAIPDKKQHFKSKVVLLTSNLYRPHVPSIVEINALYRRFDVSIKVKAVDKSLNPQQFIEQASDKPMDLENIAPMVRFDIVNTLTDTVLNKDLTYEQLRQYLAVAYNKKKEKNNQRMADIEAYLKAPSKIVLQDKLDFSTVAENPVYSFDEDLSDEAKLRVARTFWPCLGMELHASFDPDDIDDYGDVSSSDAILLWGAMKDGGTGAELFPFIKKHINHLSHLRDAMYTLFGDDDLGEFKDDPRHLIEVSKNDIIVKDGVVTSSLTNRVKIMFDRVKTRLLGWIDSLIEKIKAHPLFTIVAITSIAGFLFAMYSKSGDILPETYDNVNILPKRKIIREACECVEPSLQTPTLHRSEVSPKGWAMKAFCTVCRAFYFTHMLSRMARWLKTKSDEQCIRKKCRENGIEPEMYSDEQSSRAIADKYVYNVARMYVTNGGRTKFHNNVFFVKGRIGMTVNHGLPVDPDSIIKIVFPNIKGQKEYSCKLSEVDIVNDPKRDLAMVSFPKNFRTCSDVVNHIISDKDLPKITYSYGSLVTYRGMTDPYVMCQSVDICANDLTRTVNNMPVAVRNLYSYNCETEDGDCGSPLFVYNKAAQRKIIGIHAFGSIDKNARSLGYGLSITSELINEWCEKLDALQYTYPDHVQMGTETCDKLADFEIVGKVDVVPSSSMNNLYTQSPFFEIFPNEVANTQLRPVTIDGVLVDPLEKALSKCAVSVKDVDKTVIARAGFYVSQVLMSNDDRKRVLTTMEAIAGVEGDPFMNGIKRSTSAGFGYEYSEKKFDILGREGDYEVKPEFLDRVKKYEDDMSKGVHERAIWIDTLKPELRPIEKVKQAKTRVFSIPPLHFQVLFRKYFLGFAAQCMEGRIDNEIAVGINPYSDEWTKLALRLQTKGEDVIAGDFSNFDGTLGIPILHEILNIINRWYDGTPEEERMRTILWDDIIFSLHTAYGKVYAWNHSNPSGNPFTTIINSIYNSMSMRIIYSYLTRQPMGYFGKHVNLISYGDDNVLNIDHTIIDTFNQQTITKAYNDIFGMTYTNESKSGDILPARRIDDVSFLKRKFSKHGAQYLAPIEKPSIYKQLCWLRSKGVTNTRELMKMNAENALRESALHGLDFYKEMSKKLAPGTRDYDFTILDYSDQLSSMGTWAVHYTDDF